MFMYIISWILFMFSILLYVAKQYLHHIYDKACELCKIF